MVLMSLEWSDILSAIALVNYPKFIVEASVFGNGHVLEGSQKDASEVMDRFLT